jgi:transposase
MMRPKRKPKKPRRKNLLHAAASQYLKGAFAATYSAPELHELENDLLAALEKTILITTENIAQVAVHLDALGEKKAAILKNMDNRNPLLDKNYRALDKRYLALIRILCRLMSAKCRLLTDHHKVMAAWKKRNDLTLFLSQNSPPPANPLSALLSDPPNCFSRKTKFFYSKLFRKTMDLTDDQWLALKDLVPQKILSGAGRPPQSSRNVLNGVLWKLRTAASWDDLPREYPSHQTCYRYYAQWLKVGVLDRVIQTLLEHLNHSGFNLYSSMENGDIELVQLAKQTHIRFAPRLQDTWQSSTALLILQTVIAKKRKEGGSVKSINQSYPLDDQI